MKTNHRLFHAFLCFLTLFCISILFLGFTPASSPAVVQMIVIDAGHGGKDPGTIGHSVHEKKITLAIALELGRTLQKNIPGIKVAYTRTKDEFVELHKRAEIANKYKADVFISLHCNAAPRRMANRQYVHGTSTFVMGLHKTEENLEIAMRENSVILKEANYQSNYGSFDPDSPQSYILLSLRQQTHLQNSLRLAHKIEHQFKAQVKRKSRGVKQAGFVVLSETTMPCVLVELGFLSNPSEEQFLKSTQGQTYMAHALYRAIRDYKKELEAN